MQTLAGVLASTLLAVTGITNKSLRALMTGLPGTAFHSLFALSCQDSASVSIACAFSASLLGARPGF